MSAAARMAEEEVSEEAAAEEEEEEVASPRTGARGQTRILANTRVLIGCSTPSRDQISSWITELGGSVLSPMQYDLCTHIYLEEENFDSGEVYIWLRDNKKLIQKSWLKQAYADNIMPENGNKVPSCSNNIDADKRTDFRPGRVKRILCFDENEEIIMSNHQLFLCKADMSTVISMTVYVQEMQETLVRNEFTPGTFPQHQSNTTNPQIKAVIKEAYVLLKSLNRAGYSLCGQFSTDNFVIDTGKGQLNVRFAGINADTLKKSDPDNDNLDIQGLKKMVRRQIFWSKMVPHDVNLWLFLIGKKECEDIVPNHIYLLDYPEWTEPFMTWYDMWGNLKSSDMEKYGQILDQLEGYKGWKAVLEGNEKNTYLEDTLSFEDPNLKKKVDYLDDAYGLLHMLRNCRHHKALGCLRSFSLIVCQYFPNLISDLQLAVVKAGVIKLPA